MWRFGDFLDKEKVTRRRLDTPKVRFVLPCRVSGTEKINKHQFDPPISKSKKKLTNLVNVYWLTRKKIVL